jgi:hypothetical protein
MAWFVAAVTGLGFDEFFAYIEELHNDQALLDHLCRAAVDLRLRRVMDPEPRYGRRATWYAIVRATRPQHNVETGSTRPRLLCVCRRATPKHGPGSPWSLDRARYGDSIGLLAASASPVDLFLHDSDHHYDHESVEYRPVAGALTESALVMTDNGGLAFSDFAKSSGCRFLMFREDPADHWAAAGVLGVALDVAT